MSMSYTVFELTHFFVCLIHLLPKLQFPILNIIIFYLIRYIFPVWFNGLTDSRLQAPTLLAFSHSDSKKERLEIMACVK